MPPRTPRQISGLQDAAGAALGKKVAEFTDIAATLGTASGAAAANAVTVVDTAAELVKRKVGGAFGAFATTEGMVKAQVGLGGGLGGGLRRGLGGVWVGLDGVGLAGRVPTTRHGSPAPNSPRGRLGWR